MSIVLQDEEVEKMIDELRRSLGLKTKTEVVRYAIKRLWDEERQDFSLTKEVR